MKLRAHKGPLAAAGGFVLPLPKQRYKHTIELGETDNQNIFRLEVVEEMKYGCDPSLVHRHFAYLDLADGVYVSFISRNTSMAVTIYGVFCLFRDFLADDTCELFYYQTNNYLDIYRPRSLMPFFPKNELLYMIFLDTLNCRRLYIWFT